MQRVATPMEIRSIQHTEISVRVKVDMQRILKFNMTIRSFHLILYLKYFSSHIIQPHLTNKVRTEEHSTVQPFSTLMRRQKKQPRLPQKKHKKRMMTLQLLLLNHLNATIRQKNTTKTTIDKTLCKGTAMPSSHQNLQSSKQNLLTKWHKNHLFFPKSLNSIL